MAIKDDLEQLIIWKIHETMRQQYRVYTADNIRFTCLISMAEQEMVFCILFTIIGWAQRVQSTPEIMLKFMKIKLTKSNM